MAKAEKLPDGRIWVVRDDTSSLFLSPEEAKTIVAAYAASGRRGPTDVGVESHLAKHRELGRSHDVTEGLAAWDRSRT
jgi:hypothetical protein